MSPLSAQEPVPSPFADEDRIDPSEAEPTHFDPDVSRPKMIEVYCEWVEMSHEQLTELMFLRNERSSDATALRKSVAELVKEGKAEILETAMVIGRSGEKATSEAVSEYSYPTEYEASRIPNTVTVNGVSGDGLTLRTPELATAFETRRLGTTVEIGPQLGPDWKLIDLQIAPELVWHTGNTVWLETKDAAGNVTKVEMPEFYIMRAATSLTCIDGQYHLVAIQSPKDASGRTAFKRKVMFFVRCDVQVVKEGE